MISLTSIKLHNFLSHADTTFELSNRGLVLIQGRNGAGKSSLLSSIPYALFGTDPEGAKGDDVIRDGQSVCSVTLSGFKDSDEFEVIRSRGPASLTFSVNGNDLSGPSIKATQEKIEAFLGLDYLTFMSVVMFPQGTKGIAALPQTEQRQILSRILDLERFEEAFAKVKSYKDSLTEDLASKNSELLQIQNSVAAETRHLEQLEEAKKSFKADQDRRISNIRKDLDKLRPIDVNIDVLNECRQLESDDPFHSNQKLMAEYALIDRKHQTAVTKVATAKARCHTLLETLVAPQDQRGSACGACGQDLPLEARKEAQERYRTMLVEHLAKKQLLQEQLKQLAEEETSLAVTRANTDREYKQKQKDSESKVKRLNELRQILTAAKSLEIKRKSLEDAIEAEESRGFTGDSSIKRARKTLEELQTRLPQIEKEVKDLKSELEYASFWHDGFGSTGIRHWYLASITPYLSERANYYLRALTDGRGELSITTQRENKKGGLSEELTIEAKVGGGRNYRAKSGGEKRRIDLALLFALAELMSTKARIKVDLLIMDESYEGLDSQGCDDALKLLKQEVLPHKGTILLIAHNPLVSDYVDQTVTINNVDGVSVVDSASHNLRK